MTRPGLSATRAAGGATALSVALVSGCSVFSEQATQLDYTPSDGAQADVGDVAVRNIFFVAEDEGSAGSLVAVFLNSGEDDVDVTLSAENGLDETFSLPAGESVSVGPDGDETIEVESIGIVPGRTLPVTVSAAEQTADIVTPVLDGSIPEYAELLPTESS